jgi:NitT/TauT family transport system substrate-binding protein
VAVARGLLVTVLLGTGAGCAPQDPGPELDRVRLVVQQHFSNIPLLLADAKGHFRRHGIEIERVPLEQGSQALALLIDGAVDAAAMAATVNFLSAVERGANLRVVASKGHYTNEHCAQSGLLVRADWKPPQGDPAALREYVRGRRVAITNSVGTSFFVSRVLASVGLREQDVEFLSIPHAAKLDALASGRVDIAHLGEPHVTRAVAAGFVLWRSAEDVLAGRDHAYLVAAPRLFERDRDLGARFLAAYLDGIGDYGEGKTDENVAIVARETKIDPALLLEACWPAVRADGAVDVESIRELAAWAVERDLLERAPDAERLVDRGLIEEARRRREGRDR